ncbi:sensor histidine kinase [Flammeovirga kamogawensis]|uniref:histidine kinase n=1 Tax=Flammeovirga kamogawensis TaxID=373891 RepID=A0ABX8GW01_9BACT|nr:PAS domain-containing sensor histidine kinase [Flammeovirga kamogawensis]MBB6461576.1 PAS domain S-box-containing protein [Flammeovirga kamogawensis]QWG07493.1 PAS domain-containing sensor histidine kinase [Flammeovirga kamogawensis]TRX69306.1 GHKL domain-containing protein [Flammeovirga kamogawensis]
MEINYLELTKEEIINELEETKQRELLWKQRFESSINNSSISKGDFIKDFLNDTTLGYWEWDFETNREFLSDRYINMFGYNRNNFPSIQEAWQDMVHDDDIPEMMKAMEEHIASHGEKIFHNIARWKNRENQIIWVYCRGQVAEWKENGEPKKLIGYHIDITSQKEVKHLKNKKFQLEQKNKELHRINEELNRFVYSASHDLKSPISSAISLIELYNNTEDKNDVDEYITLISKCLSTLDHFAEKIVDTLKMQNVALNTTCININDMMQEIVNDLSFLPNAQKVKVQWTSDDFEWKTDDYRLKLILSNLVSNSIKYCNLFEEKPYVRLKFSSENNIGNVIIEDNGKGITSENQKSIYDMFFRADNSENGTGLGLYIVKETLDKLNGQINLKSIYGKGSKFDIHVPLF